MWIQMSTDECVTHKGWVVKQNYPGIGTLEVEQRIFTSSCWILMQIKSSLLSFCIFFFSHVPQFEVSINWSCVLVSFQVNVIGWSSDSESNARCKRINRWFPQIRIMWYFYQNITFSTKCRKGKMRTPEVLLFSSLLSLHVCLAQFICAKWQSFSLLST